MYTLSDISLSLCSEWAGLPWRQIAIDSAMASSWNTGFFSILHLSGNGSIKEIPVLHPELEGSNSAIFSGVHCYNGDSGETQNSWVMVGIFDAFGGISSHLRVRDPFDLLKDFELFGFEKQVLRGAAYDVIVFNRTDEAKRDQVYVSLVEDVRTCRNAVEQICQALTRGLSNGNFMVKPILPPLMPELAEELVVAANPGLES